MGDGEVVPRKLKAVWTPDPEQDYNALRHLSLTKRYFWLYRPISAIVRLVWKWSHPGYCYNCYCNWTIRKWLRKWPSYYAIPALEDFLANELRKAIDEEILKGLLNERR